MNKTVKLLLYCTKAKPYLVFNNGIKGLCDYSLLYSADGLDILNGKIVAEAECDLVEKEDYSYACDDYASFDDDRLEATCLSRNQLNDYGKYKSLYLIHLKNVKLFNEPKKLSEYFHPQNSCMNSFGWLVDAMEPIKRASQNMMYAYDKDGNLYVFISIQSPYMCDIMNDKKTIELRTSILNLLKELIPNE